MIKHYIKIDENDNIIDCFTDAFKNPDVDSILIAENEDRHFNLELFEYYYDFEKIYNYKYVNEEIIKKTETQKNIEKNNFKNSSESKTKKIKELRLKLFKIGEFVINIWNAQEYGHGKSLNQYNKILEETLYNQWVVWFEDLSYILSNIDINSINYEDIHINNTDIFPIMPGFPGDIIE